MRNCCLLLAVSSLWLLLLWPKQKIRDSLPADYSSEPFISEPSRSYFPLKLPASSPIFSIKSKIFKPRHKQDLTATRPVMLKNIHNKPVILLTDISPVKGAEALGGDLSLESLNEPLMPSAALVERSRWKADTDPMVSLPEKWRGRFRDLIRKQFPFIKLSQAVHWHEPLPNLCRSISVPVLLRANESPVVFMQPLDPLVTDALSAWLQQTPIVIPQQAMPVLISFEALKNNC
jgi:hypothetical protein